MLISSVVIVVVTLIVVVVASIVVVVLVVVRKGVMLTVKRVGATYTVIENVSLSSAVSVEHVWVVGGSILVACCGVEGTLSKEGLVVELLELLLLDARCLDVSKGGWGMHVLLDVHKLCVGRG